MDELALAEDVLQQVQRKVRSGGEYRQVGEELHMRTLSAIRRTRNALETLALTAPSAVMLAAVAVQKDAVHCLAAAANGERPSFDGALMGQMQVAMRDDLGYWPPDSLRTGEEA
jgi:hypothetical protein